MNNEGAEQLHRRRAAKKARNALGDDAQEGLQLLFQLRFLTQNFRLKPKINSFQAKLKQLWSSSL